MATWLLGFWNKLFSVICISSPPDEPVKSCTEERKSLTSTIRFPLSRLVLAEYLRCPILTDAANSEVSNKRGRFWG